MKIDDDVRGDLTLGPCFTYVTNEETVFYMFVPKKAYTNSMMKEFKLYDFDPEQNSYDLNRKIRDFRKQLFRVKTF